ncbi:integration host factor subunit alpha [Candidatus Thioglobus sp.]|uniref:integration host factor subunit alpha n=1 Tax=Candidatus Thioglobus sp. TaxID=2026721 RepID=UPI003D0B2919
MSLSKKNIAEELVREMGITHAQALQLTHNFFDQMLATLASGEAIKLSSFGNFVIREKAARPGRNPQTGEVVEVSARKVVNFKPGPKLKNLTKES